MSGLDEYFGLNQQALKIHSRRAEIIAGNLANADTPNFKARDVDFKAALQQAKVDAPQSTLRTTHANHISAGGSQASSVDSILGEMKYRIPSQPSIDGNTVDPLMEKSAFMENAMLYQTNMRFLSGKIKSLMSAIKVD
jgi:flagellar basal-body rod protein FlgB